jgi:hypothetical protein
LCPFRRTQPWEWAGGLAWPKREKYGRPQCEQKALAETSALRDGYFVGRYLLTTGLPLALALPLASTPPASRALPARSRSLRTHARQLVGHRCRVSLSANVRPAGPGDFGARGGINRGEAKRRSW